MSNSTEAEPNTTWFENIVYQTFVNGVPQGTFTGELEFVSQIDSGSPPDYFLDGQANPSIGVLAILPPSAGTTSVGSASPSSFTSSLSSASATSSSNGPSSTLSTTASPQVTSTPTPSTSTTSAASSTSQASAPAGGIDSSGKIGLGVGIGIGVPLVLILLAIAILLFRSSRRRDQATRDHQHQESSRATPGWMPASFFTRYNSQRTTAPPAYTPAVGRSDTIQTTSKAELA